MDTFVTLRYPVTILATELTNPGTFIGTELGEPCTRPLAVQHFYSSENEIQIKDFATKLSCDEELMEGGGGEWAQWGETKNVMQLILKHQNIFQEFSEIQIDQVIA